MIVLDTNVISEMTKPEPAPAVIAWLNSQPLETLYLSAITIAEQGFGIQSLDAGRRRRQLEEALAQTRELFAGRILAFDEAAAVAYSHLAAEAKSKGRGFPMADGYIAAIAAVHVFSVATRDVSPFLAVGIPVINPWEAPA